ncbi:MAG: NADH-quinone oxidoreductase subunit M [Candidatus Thiodiazotropha sp. (ex Lucina aurantia)]|nr:NADH-quinone oxidoreductase subunit M [Candidatus Thiodiazotropha sp. (ex Lucina pensylvanica)]MBT3017374.1 NADH-quinone oxidoreductase subunit M [Candidatus Thiodiazotropha taylori]MBT3042611.1 NADH-quinone oxidoreductase subunit M [Candidatus Thiodiazotropha sp. (ex Codakia orbicularis)]MBV2103058.1 NADH-quinone oxidoreductase subunit M [Candidatus Thiodiazotropha sp. (ex Lucina aurantia)]MCG7864219.1 NADH-quinone oxidoreductase subunit M [Candidatus Thiodiazotropha endolucinida]
MGSLQAMTDLPLLSTLLLLPLAGAGAIWFFPVSWARMVTLATLLCALLPAIAIVVLLESDNPGFQFIEHYPWIPALDANFRFGVDGLSAAFLPLTILLFIAATLASWTHIRGLQRVYFNLLLLFATATLGVFMSIDVLAFFLFWELTLAPLYFLISLWGIGPHRRYAATKYTLFMLAGGIPLLLAIAVLAFNHAEIAGAIPPDGLTFDYQTLLDTPLPAGLEVIVFLFLLVGFAVKTPLFPLHTWLPIVALEGPAPVAALLVGIKLGAYGIIRFAVPLAPAAAQELHWLLAGLGVIGLLYGALAAINQTNLRRMLAYSSMSHVGLVILGIASFNLQGLQGAVFQLLNFVVIAGGLFLLTGYLHHRLGSTDLIHLGGVAQTMPLLAAFFMFLGLASLGIPGTSGFPAELLILISALETHTGAGLAALFGLIIGTGYLLNSYRQSFFGPITDGQVSAGQDLRPKELAIMMLFSLLVLVFGLFPGVVLNLMESTAGLWLMRLQ